MEDAGGVTTFAIMSSDARHDGAREQPKQLTDRNLPTVKVWTVFQLVGAKVHDSGMTWIGRLSSNTVQVASLFSLQENGVLPAANLAAFGDDYHASRNGGGRLHVIGELPNLPGSQVLSKYTGEIMVFSGPHVTRPGRGPDHILVRQ